MLELGVFVGGLLVGAVIAWLWAAGRGRAADAALGEIRRQLEHDRGETESLRGLLAAEQQTRVAAQTRLDAMVKGFEEQKRLLSDAEKALKDAFAALSAEALKNNTEFFAKQTEEKVKPLKEALDKYEKQIIEMEKARQGAYAGISEQMKTIGAASQQLNQQTSKLVNALRAPQVRGRWGEITLQRVVEVAGLSHHCDFAPQVSIASETGRLRPDLVVMLPGQRSVVVDAKTPLVDYLSAVEAADEESRQGQLRRHAAAVRTHMQSLSSKRYWDQLDATPEFVVMFLPGESFFSAALEQDRELIEDGMKAGVILATPTTLIALLRTVAYSWQQQEVAENARRIAEAARELFERVSVFAGHFGGIGKSLQQAAEVYNRAARSWETRVVPSGRRMPDLGATQKGAEFPELPLVEAQPAIPMAEA